MKISKLIRMQDIVMGTIAISSLFLLFNANGAFASSVVDEFTVTVPESCSLTSTVGTAHTATIENGVYSDDVGETTINAFCNDSEGFSVYAVGYTDDTFGNNTMKPSTLADTKAIATGLAASGDTSNWAMKLTSLSDNYTLTNDFESYHLVPDEYTKVATYPSNTTTTAGVNIKSTYAAYISQTQPADTYTGKVKYTIVHPSNADAPAAPAMLDTGSTINVKMKNLANNISNAQYYTDDTKIKAFRRSDTLPNDFVATDSNTISTLTSGTPIYIFFDNTDSEGIMYYYAENNTPIIANQNVSRMFYTLESLEDIAGLSDFDTSKVTSMSSIFQADSSLSDLSPISNWDTTKVTDMSYAFVGTKITNVGALATGKNNNPNIWNTGNVTNMSNMFHNCKSITDISGLSNWDTAQVTDMNGMFYYTNISSLDALAPNKNNNPNIWNTGNVTNMRTIFSNCSSLTDITGISNWDTAQVTDMSSMFSGTKISSLDALAPNKNNNPNIWNTGNVTTMENMFVSCSSLTNIAGVSNWDTTKVTKMSYMFGSTKITNLNALEPGKNNNPSIWNTGNVIDMRYMFSGITTLTDVKKIKSWDVSRVKAKANDWRYDQNYFYGIFDRVSSSTISSFSFTNRSGYISSTNNNTYVPSS